MGRALTRTGELFPGCRKLLARKKPEIRFSTLEAGLFGQKPIKRTQKYVLLGVFGHCPQISKCPYAKNITL